MRFCKTLAIVAVVALTMFGAKGIKADGAPPDPLSKITVPIDPNLEPCAEVAAPTVCFSENDINNPVDIAGPTAAQIASDPLFDIVTNFVYEPCTGDTVSTCDQNAVLPQLFLAIVPTVSNTIYTCAIGTPTDGLETAFNTCSLVGFTSQPDPPYELLELTCNPSVGPCTGMLAGEMGSAELMPEPGELSLLAIGVALVGICSWKRRKMIETGRQNLANWAASQI
jgi:hypothetical protein